MQLATGPALSGLSIELEPDMRHGVVRYNNYIFNAKVWSGIQCYIVTGICINYVC